MNQRMSPSQLMDISAPSSAQARRLLALKRALQQQLNRRPTTLEKALMARLAKAEAGALDPSITVADFYRLDSIARKARAEFNAIIAAKAEPKPLTLADYLREGAGA